MLSVAAEPAHESRVKSAPCPRRGRKMLHLQTVRRFPIAAGPDYENVLTN